MATVTIQEIERDPAGYLHRVEAGETLVITRDELPVAEIKPLPGVPRERRPAGLARGQFTVPNDFDDPLPKAVLKDFEGG